LLILDYQTVQLLGPLVGKIIKNASYDQKPKILFLCSEDESIEKEFQLNRTGLLYKPVRKDDLLDRLVSKVDLSKKSEVREEDAIRLISNNHKIKVLLVEDNLVNQKLLIKYFQKMDVYCDLASNGQEALNILEKNAYDLILMDCQMPIMDGYTATALIRKLEGHGHRTPIIALTAHAMAKEYDKCMASGMDDYLSKPLDFNQLNQMVLKYVQLEKK